MTRYRFRCRLLILPALLVWLLAACGRGAAEPAASAQTATRATTAAPRPDTPTTGASPVAISRPTATRPTTPTPIPTPTPTNTSPTAAAVAPPPEVRPARDAFINSKVWSWTSLTRSDGQTIAVEAPQEYALVFWLDGTFDVMAECNAGGGTYVLGGNGAISFDLAPMTRVPCLPDSRVSEYLAALSSARMLEESDDKLLMALEDGDRLMFANLGQVDATDAGLVDLTLRWPGYTDAVGNDFAVDDPKLYALHLRADGTYTAWADCDIVWGTYVYRPTGALTLLPGPAAPGTCPVGSQSEAFLEFLTAVRGVAVGEDGLVTMTTLDGRRSAFLDLGPIEGPGVHGRVASDVPPQRLFNTVWQWVNTSRPNGMATEVAAPGRYYFVLLDDDTYAFVADCNRGAFGYAAGEALLAFNTQGLEANPLDACGEESLSDEFLGDLSLVESYNLADADHLVLGLFGGGVMTLANGGPFFSPDDLNAKLAGGTWQWTSFRGGGQDFPVPESAYFAVRFNDDRVELVADCSQGVGAYSTGAGGSTVIMVQRLLPITCSTGQLVDAFFKFLNQATALHVDANGVLTVELTAGDETMIFVPAS